MRNKILKFAILFIFFITRITAFSQVSWGEPEEYKLGLSEQAYEKLKKGTVYFVIPDYMMEDKDEFVQAVKQNWTFSEIEIIGLDDYPTYAGRDDAIFLTFEASFFEGKTFESARFKMWCKKVKKDKLHNIEDDYYGGFSLILEKESYDLVTSMRMKPAMKLFTEGGVKFVNFKPGIVASYLRVIQYGLENRLKYEDVKKSTTIKNLIEDTLFITDDLINTHKLTEEEFAAIYPYPYKFVTLDEMNYMLLTNRKFFYYISVSHDIQFVNNKTGELICPSLYPNNLKEFKILLKHNVKVIKRVEKTGKQ